MTDKQHYIAFWSFLGAVSLSLFALLWGVFAILYELHSRPSIDASELQHYLQQFCGV